MCDGNDTQQPQAPEVPTLTENMQEYMSIYPELLNMDVQNAPKIAQSQLDLINQFAAPTGIAMREAQEQVNPELANLLKEFTGQVTEGISGDLPDVLKDQYMSDIRANLGTNVGGQIGATALAREMFGLGEARRQSFMNPAMSLLGGYQMPQAVAPQFQQTISSLTPGQAVSAQTNRANTMANLFGTQSSLYANEPSDPFGQLLGGFGGQLAGSYGTGIGTGMSNLIFK